jgi:tRNA dimethylallyltransferase
VGPTASGKSAVAMAVARATPGVELVAVDAMQVYRGMDIGTAKPDHADRAEVPHHGLDLADPSEEFTVVDHRAAASAALAAIAARGGTALLVGGAGLYLRAIIDGLEPPARWPLVAEALDTQPDTRVLYERLAAVDPAAAARIEPGNRRRVLRALEVCIGGGRPFSTYGPGLATYGPTPVTQIGLRWPRAVLATRIAGRFEAMLAVGLLHEVAELHARPASLSRTAGQALGYRELGEHLDGRLTLDEAVRRAVARTRRFAVRQERWFRRDPRVHWVDVHDDPAEAVPAVLGALRALGAPA